MALCEASKEAAYLRQLLSDIFGKPLTDPVPLFEDNKACRFIAEDAKHHNRAKHIDIQYHFSRECQQSGKTKVVPVNSQRQLADFLTKYLSPVVLQRLTIRAFGHLPSFFDEDMTTPLVSPTMNKKGDKLQK